MLASFDFAAQRGANSGRAGRHPARGDPHRQARPPAFDARDSTNAFFNDNITKVEKKLFGGIPRHHPLESHLPKWLAGHFVEITYKGISGGTLKDFVKLLKDDEQFMNSYSMP